MNPRYRLAPTGLAAASRNQWQPNDGTNPALPLLDGGETGASVGTITLADVLVAMITGTGGVGATVTAKVGLLTAAISGNLTSSGSVAASLPLLTSNILGSVNAAMSLTLLTASISGSSGSIGAVAAKLSTPKAASFVVTQVTNGAVAVPLTLPRSAIDKLPAP
ncbi:MAG: hypothetical protein SGJ26_10740 [Nitrospirota bacterium]|nr:hypothetical protein [Nitrospirota bacterium]